MKTNSADPLPLTNQGWCGLKKPKLKSYVKTETDQKDETQALDRRPASPPAYLPLAGGVESTVS